MRTSTSASIFDLLQHKMVLGIRFEQKAFVKKCCSIGLLLVLCLAASAQKNKALKLLTKDTVVCCNQSCVQQIGNFINVKGGAEPYRYRWSGAVTCNTCENPQAYIKGTVTYFVTVTDAKKNVVRDSLRITSINCIDTITDSDLDGVPDYIDSCKNISGVKDNFGCPWPDTDEDGIPDKSDDCPTLPGFVGNKGCPVLDSLELAALKNAAQKIKFEGITDVISSSSFASLNTLSVLLLKKTGSRLLIEVHTDNVGPDEKNLILSQKRAEAIKNYLAKKGIDKSRLNAFGYGEMNPIADNDTPQGRLKNRRVELTASFR